MNFKPIYYMLLLPSLPHKVLVVDNVVSTIY
jgi:hypothetical protein